MADILGISTSGLLAFQRALTTTSHNISNVNTEGYSRQRVGMETTIPEYIGVGYAGTGVRVSDITRNYDDFLVTQLRTQTSNNQRYTAFYDLASQIDNMLADQNAGLGPMMDEFFASTQSVADNPNSIPARQVMLTSAESLADRFHYLDQRLRDLNTRVNQQLDASVYEVNTLAAGIAQLNEDISLARGAAGGADPNDLLDRRDMLINQLSELVDIKTVEQHDGMVNVFIGTGQGLVVGKDLLRLSVDYDELVQGRASVMLGEGPGSVDISRLIKGGKIGGTLEFSSSILDESRNALGRIAAGVSEQFNELHRLGIDLTGQLGDDFFTAFNPEVFVPRNPPNSDPNANLVVSYEDVSQLTTKDYLLRYDGNYWQVSDYKTGQSIYRLDPANPPAGYDGTFVVDGIRVDLSSVPQTQGDRYLIRPTNNAANVFGVNVDDPTRIAAAGAIQGAEQVSAANLPTNIGTGQISNVTALNRDYLPLSTDITLDFSNFGLPWTDGEIDITLLDSSALAANEGSVDVSTGNFATNFSGINIQNLATSNFAGLDARFTVDGVEVILDNDYGSLAGVVAEINNQLGLGGSSATVELDSGDQLIFRDDGVYGALAITGLNQDALDAGMQASPGLAGGLGVSFLVDGQPVTLDVDYTALTLPDDLEAAIETQLGGAYTVSFAGGTLNIVNNTATETVVISGGNAGAVLSGLFDQPAEVPLSQFNISGIGPTPLYVEYDPVADGGATFMLLHNTVDDTYRVTKYESDDDINVNEVAMMSFSLSGRPANEDGFFITNNTNAVGDNRNALAMAALQTDKGMMNGTATLQATYGQMVSRVGTQAHQASINKDATHTLRTQAEAAVQSVSGVNLDEEAANLIRFQQAYQANAQVISVANSLFQTLLQAF